MMLGVFWSIKIQEVRFKQELKCQQYHFVYCIVWCVHKFETDITSLKVIKITYCDVSIIVGRWNVIKRGGGVKKYMFVCISGAGSLWTKTIECHFLIGVPFHT